jgi:hypothetical protein
VIRTLCHDPRPTFEWRCTYAAGACDKLEGGESVTRECSSLSRTCASRTEIAEAFLREMLVEVGGSDEAAACPLPSEAKEPWEDLIPLAF